VKNETGITSDYQIAAQTLAIPGLDLTPGAATMFPWLSGIAGNFEKFRFHSLKLNLISSNATTTPGRVYMAIDYDYDDDPNVTKTALMANMSAVEGPAWSGLELKADTKALMSDMPWKFVSQATRPNFVEARTSHCGFVIVAFDGPYSTSVRYDLIVEYEIELAVPCLEPHAVVDTFTGRVLEATPSVLPAFGSGYAQPISLAGAPALLKVVTPGVSCPPLTHLLGNFSAALDCATLPRNGRLSAKSEFYVGVSTPATVMDASEPKVQFNFYDYLGGFLGNLGAITKGLDQTTGPTDPGMVSIASEDVTVTGGFPLAELFERVPKVRYAVPFIQGIAALAAGSIKSGLHLEV